MEQYIKIEHQDGLIYFDKFEETDLYYYPDNFGNLVIQIDIKSEYEPYTDEEMSKLEFNLNRKLNRDFEYAWVELSTYPTQLISIDNITDKKIFIEKGYEIDEEQNSIAHIYFGWSIELFENIIEFRKIENNIYIFWKAVSDDVQYYDNRAKECSMELCCKLNLVKFNSEEEYYSFLRKKIHS